MKEGKKMRKGFSLIELMFVVAIIVILAAVIIPNFTDITDRSKTARVSEDFSSIATALELYRADWGKFPEGTDVPVRKSDGSFFKEMTGIGTTNATTNKTITGFPGGISYLKPDTLSNLVSPFDPTDTYYYTSNGHAWILFVKGSDRSFLYRTDSTSALRTDTATPGLTP